MILRERRRHFFINKSLQLRYMLTFSFILLVVTGASLASLYFGIWGEVLNSFSNGTVVNDLATASRLQQYEEARDVRTATPEPFSTLSFFKQAERLSERQREIFNEILDRAHHKLVEKLFLLLLFIALGTVFLSHKIAGPLYRLHVGLDELAKGNVKMRIYLRKSDEAQFLGVRFNETAEHLDFVFGRLKNIVNENEANPARLTARLKEELAKIKTSAEN